MVAVWWFCGGCLRVAVVSCSSVRTNKSFQCEEKKTPNRKGLPCLFKDLYIFFESKVLHIYNTQSRIF